MKIDKDDRVRHPQFGEGRVRMVDEDTAIVRFESGRMEECLLAQLTRLTLAVEKGRERQLDDPLATLAHAMAACIRSINDEWGVFSSSRITLLPHQLWICRQVYQNPMRWLIADDVGLGKTVEAGLILSALHAAGRMRRALILVPASLVTQWQERLLGMFDLRFDIYRTENDTKKSGFWHGERAVIASLETLRSDVRQRWQRLLDAEAWDIVLVDEAHRLNMDEVSGMTLGYKLLATLEQHKRVNSLLFFTGTPHRGKDYGFLSLLSLLRPDLFSPRQTLEAAFDHLPSVMLRNNKKKVTDMQGRPLFPPVHIHKEEYTYSKEEFAFYERLTEFILSGRTYARERHAAQQRVLTFVLLTLQKLASSSLAAIRRALQKRITFLQSQEEKLASARATRIPAPLEEALESYEDGAEDMAAELAITGAPYQLPNEIASLQMLLELVEPIRHETKIDAIIQKIRTEYPRESILFFTEYKATQALLVARLRREFGADCTTFINGDESLRFTGEHGTEHLETMGRHQAAEAFRKGDVRFLVSTEAAGEGIDLQENCHVLFHVDLPWNPMRLHQRVGRLHRYGQKHPVHVHLFRNPETVESQIWEKLEEKLRRITLAFQGAMEDPEDMCQAVIGMVQPSLYTTLFSSAPENRQGLQQWFDSQTAELGGADVVSVVKRMFGSVRHFDFGTQAANLPQIALHDLCPYLKLCLARHQRKWKEDDTCHISFKTPKAWLSSLALAESYHLVFSRELPCADDEDRAGLGHALLNRAVEEGFFLQEDYSSLPGLSAPIFILRVRDRSTEKTQILQRIYGVEKHASDWKLYKDWELLLLLNSFADKPRQLRSDAVGAVHPPQEDFDAARQWLLARADSLQLPFAVPYIEVVACLCPEIEV